CSERARGRTAQAGSSSFLNEDSYSTFFMVFNAGRIRAGASRRTDGEPGCFEGAPRYRTNSSSLRRASRTYFESSTMIVPNSRVPHRSTDTIPIGPSPAICKVVYYRDPILFLPTLGVFG